MMTMDLRDENRRLRREVKQLSDERRELLTQLEQLQGQNSVLRATTKAQIANDAALRASVGQMCSNLQHWVEHLGDQLVPETIPRPAKRRPLKPPKKPWVAPQRADLLAEITGLPAEAFITTAQAAAYLSLSPGVLAAWRPMRAGPRYHGSNEFIRYKISDLAEWMATRANEILPAQPVLSLNGPGNTERG